MSCSQGCPCVRVKFQIEKMSWACSCYGPISISIPSQSSLIAIAACRWLSNITAKHALPLWNFQTRNAEEPDLRKNTTRTSTRHPHRPPPPRPSHPFRYGHRRILQQRSSGEYGSAISPWRGEISYLYLESEHVIAFFRVWDEVTSGMAAE